MNFRYLKNFIKKKINDHHKNIYFLRIFTHLLFFILYKKYRKNRCLIDVPVEIFYKFKVLAKLFYIPTYLFSKYLKKRKIFISINNSCNWSIGHIYAEIGQLKRMQEIDTRYSKSNIWFPTTRKEILGEGKDIFEDDNFKIVYGGIKYIFLNLVALNDKSVTIDGSVGHFNLYGEKNYSNRFAYNNKHKKYGKIMANTNSFYPLKSKSNIFDDKKKKLFKNLDIKKKYIVLQLKEKVSNATFALLNPSSLLNTITYFQKKNYQLVFAGREKFPDVFKNKSIIDYANSKYTSVINDYILIENCSLVISSGSGFNALVENLDKPALVINGYHLFYNFHRRSIYLPGLLSRKSTNFNAKSQLYYLCTFGPNFGSNMFNDIFVSHIPTSEEIFSAAIELEQMLSKNIPPLSSFQKKINSFFYGKNFSHHTGRISENFIENHKNFFKI